MNEISQYDLTANLIDETGKARKERMIYYFIIAILVVITIVVASFKKQPIMIPGVSLKTLDISDVDAPATVMKYYSIVYSLETLSFNGTNYLAHFYTVKSMLAPSAIPSFESDYNWFYDNRVVKLGVSSDFQYKDCDIDLDKWVCTIHGTRTAFLSGRFTDQFEITLVVHFRKSFPGAPIYIERVDPPVEQRTSLANQQ